MQYRTLGQTELEVSALALGCNNFGHLTDVDEATAIVHGALDAGVNHFDTANAYAGGRSEEVLGRALASRRDEAVLATKFGGPGAPEGEGASPQLIRRSLDASLRRLGAGHIDLYYMHFPDPAVPIDVTMETLDELVTAGKVRAVACSNFNADQISSAQESAERLRVAPFSAVQVGWNLLERDVEDDVVPAAARVDMSVVPYFPLASGLLTGKYRRGEAPPSGSRAADWSHFSDIASDSRLRRVEQLQEIASSFGLTLLELAIGWLIAQPQVGSVLVGARRLDQLQQNIAATQRQLSPIETAEVTRAMEGISD